MERKMEIENVAYIDQLNKNIIRMFVSGFKFFFKNPVKLLFALKTLRKQKIAVKTRANLAKEGIHVPPFMIVSVTTRCNLKCKGCYSSIHHQLVGELDSGEMNESILRKVLTEAQDLGISQILVAGGEPFARPEIFEIMRDYPDIIFTVFTNGMLIDDQLVSRLKHTWNVIPIISLEGQQKETDDRRGAGVYTHLQSTFKELNKAGIIFGTSFTLTSSNFDTVTNIEFIQRLMDNGVKVFFYVEYVPVEEGTDQLIVTLEQRNKLKEIMQTCRIDLPGIFISFPGDEEELGGCLAAGRGFVHINAQGRIEPCPFAPYSDVSIQEISLRDALKSNLLEIIRSNKEILEEAEMGGGCTLWAKRELIKSLLQESQKISDYE